MSARYNYYMCKLELQKTKQCNSMPWYKKCYDTICNGGTTQQAKVVASLDHNTRFLKKGIKRFVEKFLSHTKGDIAIDISALDGAITQYSAYLDDCVAIRSTIEQRHLQHSIINVLRSVACSCGLLIFFVALIFYVRGLSTTRNIVYETVNDIPNSFNRPFFWQRNYSGAHNGASRVISRIVKTGFTGNESFGNCNTFVEKNSYCNTSQGITCEALHNQTHTWLWLCLIAIFLNIFFNAISFSGVHSKLKYITKKLDKAEQRLSDIALHMSLLADLKSDAESLDDKMVCKKELFTRPHYRLKILNLRYKIAQIVEL